MESIIMIKGKVKYPITLDPGVWIFDDRKVDLEQYFSSKIEEVNEIEEYTKSASKHWDREIMEGSVFPPTLKSEKKFEKQRVLNGSFGIPFLPFLNNAAPENGTSALIVETKHDKLTFRLDDAEEFIIGFSNKGKPLKEDGPVYIYFKDGSNYSSPIKHVRGFYVE